MSRILALLLWSRPSARLHDLPPHILRDIGAEPSRPGRNPMKGKNE